MMEREQSGTARLNRNGAGELAAAMDAWPIALAAISIGWHVRFANEAARLWLLDLQLAQLNIHGELVVSADGRLASALNGYEESLSIERMMNGLASRINVRLFRKQPVDGSDVVLMLTEATSSGDVAINVGQQFGLSEAEKTIVQGLVDGKNLADIASFRQTSLNTIRTQLRSVFRKTGTHRQAELVSLCMERLSCAA